MLRRPRPGFTLIEMLIVLALVVIVAGLSWPALRGPLASHRLREAGRVLRVELAKARLAALEAGVEQEFRYLPGAGQFRIGPVAGAFDDADAAFGPGSGEARLTAAASRPDAADPRPAPWSEHALPSGIVFSEREAFADARLLVATSEADFAAGPDDRRWSTPIVLRPDGTSTGARIVLSNNQGLSVVVALRGLTGATTLGEPEPEEGMP